MAEAEKSTDTRSDWFLANPWLWMAGGLAVCLGLWVSVQLRHDAWVASLGLDPRQPQAESPFWGLARFGLVVLGLIMVGGGLVIRMNASGVSYLEKLPSSKRYLGVAAVLALLVGLVALSISLFVGKIYGLNLPWETGSLGFVFFVVAGVCGACAYAWSTRLSGSKPVTKGQETSAMLIFSGLSVFLACWSLYLGEGDAQSRDLAIAVEKATLRGHSSSVLSVHFSPDNHTFASAGVLERSNSVTGEIKLWNSKTKQAERTFRDSGFLWDVCFSPDSKTLASASADKIIKLWDVKVGEVKATLVGHSAKVASVRFSPDGKTLASASSDRTIKLWDVETGKLKATLEGHSGSVTSVCFSPDGNYLASGSADKTIKLWAVKARKVTVNLQDHSGSVTSVCFNPDGTVLASGSDDKTVKLWDLGIGNVKATFQDHSGSVTSVCFSPDGYVLASGSDDKTVELRILDTKNAGEIRSVHSSNALKAMRNWDTIRMFLAVLTLVAFLASPLLLMPRMLQMVTVSLLVLVHFIGILHAVMTAPPAIPWTFRQTWVRFYRPYLLFMYINNAYHFYAPEPGPASSLWIYIFYELEGQDDSLLYYRAQFPKMNSKGQVDYPLSLQYFRRLSFVDKIQRSDGNQLSLYTVDEAGRQVPNPVVTYRYLNSPAQSHAQMLGAVPLRGDYKIPMHPGFPHLAQYQYPGLYARELLQSFAHHVAAKIKHPEHPDAKVVYVKIYRATHAIPPSAVVARWTKVTKRPLTELKNFEPYYYPYYMGKFSPEGKLLDAPKFSKQGRLVEGDPVLYWLIPVLNKNPNDLNSPIMDYVTYHATDGKTAIETKSP